MSVRDWKKREIERRDSRKSNFTQPARSVSSFDESMTPALLSRMLEVSTPEGKAWLRTVYSNILTQGEKQ